MNTNILPLVNAARNRAEQIKAICPASSDQDLRIIFAAHFASLIDFLDRSSVIDCVMKAFGYMDVYKLNTYRTDAKEQEELRNAIFITHLAYLLSERLKELKQ